MGLHCSVQASLAVACDILVPVPLVPFQPGMESKPRALAAWSLICLITREVPDFCIQVTCNHFA